MTNEITQNAGMHLKQMAHIIGSFAEYSHNRSTIKSWMSTLRPHSHMFYVGFLEYPAQQDLSAWDTDSKLFRDTHSRCRYRYTRLMAPSEGLSLSPEESDLRWAVEETYGAICSVLLTIGFQVERSWAEHFNQLDMESTSAPPRPASPREKSLEHHYAQLASTWSDGLEQLMAWLGWEDEFTGCSEVCAWDERCYIPMWPLIAWGGGGPGRHPPGGNATFPLPHYPPGHDGDRPPPHRGGPGGRPGGGGPGRGRPKIGHNNGFMGDETELWEPTCAKTAHFMNS
jgi:hypothetical protein